MTEVFENKVIRHELMTTDYPFRELLTQLGMQSQFKTNERSQILIS